MKTISVNQPINLRVVRFELNFATQTAPATEREKRREIKIPIVNFKRRRSEIPTPPIIKDSQKRGVQELVEDLLDDIYADQRDWSSYSHGSNSAASVTSSNTHCHEQTDSIEVSYLEDLSIEEIQDQIYDWEKRMQFAGKRLAKYVRVRDRLRRQHKKLCSAFTVLLRHITGEHGARFSVTPTLGGEGPGEGGYAEWLHAMRLVARLPAGVPQHFRRKLWLNLAERHLTARGIDWPVSERACFRGSALPDDTELGAQILKDLHRTGCSLFCGAEGRENQAMLRRVLLAYARWNKDVGYCQGFNMLAAIILEVMDKSESDSLKVMIYLVEAVLPEGYFADDLRGLSADMAAFRDLLRLRLPRLAKHMDHLQRISDGGGVEPPLPDVFTMQWFLTLYATWLQRDTLLRIWDLVLLDGNEVLLITALAIWDMLQDRILSARSADEFYSCMGGGAGAVWEAGESLVARVVALGSAPELPRLRDLHRYRVAPPAPPAPPNIQHPPLHTAVQSMTKRGLRLFYSEDEDSSDDGNRMALATVTPRREERSGTGDRLSLDIGALKRQYARLRERQRQAHVILAAACARHAAVGVPTSPTSLTVNNLLLGKSALVSSRGRRLGPPPGAVPPSRQTLSAPENVDSRSSGRSSETISWNEEKSRKSLSRRNSVKWKDIKKEKDLEKRKASIDFDETGDGIIVSESEVDEMIASVRSRSSSDSSSYSSRSASSSDTSLCDENERGSDSEADLPDDDKNKNTKNVKKNDVSYTHKITETQILRSPELKKTELSTSPQTTSEILTPEKQVRNITEYLDSAAGEPLRTYIDGFETKLRDSLVTSSEIDNFKSISPLSSVSPYNLKQNLEKNDVLHRLNSSRCEDITRNSEIIKPAQFTNLSPVDLSPCNFGITIDSESCYNYQSNFRHPSTSRNDMCSRPPDIIDSFTMYPNFVPDIDLSDKNVSDYESPPGSPGAESIVVSEDEPPIPLQIDKYFEHSPEFFGARVTDPNNSEIPNRRPPRRQCRIPKKPDSLTLQSNNNDTVLKNETERASSLPQTQSFAKNDELVPNSYAKNEIKICQLQDNVEKSCESKIDPIPAKNTCLNLHKPETAVEVKEKIDSFSPKDFMLRSGRKNSERALQIIQENSKILNRILTKQNISDASKSEDKKIVNDVIHRQQNKSKEYKLEKKIDNKLIDSPLLKESTSDSLIGYRKRSVNEESNEKNDFIRTRPISIDDPFSFEVRNPKPKNEEIANKDSKSPSSDCLGGNKTDLYGWENKGFQAKCEFKNVTRPESVYEYRKETNDLSGRSEICSNELKVINSSNWSRHSFSGESKTSVTLPSTELKDSSTYERRYTTDDYSYPFSSKYNDFLLSNASDVCSKTVDQGPKICDNLSKTDNSQVSDFAHVVTSSISFTYEPSAEDDSPTGAKSNSSDTLCQITSLDQVSTPISPKIFPNRDTPTLPKDYTEKSDKTKVESDDTCSAITSLIDTDTLSSLSYPRSPSTGSYHPFPTRPVLRVPKELGVKLGMYPKDAVQSPSK